MQIFVDADACPVTRIVEQTARERGHPLFSSLLYHASMMHDIAAAHLRSKLCMAAVQSDTNHVLSSDYSEIKIIGREQMQSILHSSTFATRGDIVVTQDYGVAAMAKVPMLWQMVYE